MTDRPSPNLRQSPPRPAGELWPQEEPEARCFVCFTPPMSTSGLGTPISESEQRFFANASSQLSEPRSTSPLPSRSICSSSPATSSTQTLSLADRWNAWPPSSVASPEPRSAPSSSPAPTTSMTAHRYIARTIWPRWPGRVATGSRCSRPTSRVWSSRRSTRSSTDESSTPSVRPGARFTAWMSRSTSARPGKSAWSMARC